MFLCFAEAKGYYQGWFNNLAAFLTKGRFCHVVVVFEIPDTYGIIHYYECSITRTGSTQKDVVKISTVEDMKDWTIYKCKIDYPTEIETYLWVQQNMVGKQYDFYTPVWSVLCCFKRHKVEAIRNKVFCSSLAMIILQQCNFWKDINPDNVTPNDLANMASKSSFFIDVTKTNRELFYEPVHKRPVLMYSANCYSNYLLL